MREKIASRHHRRSRRTVAQSPTERFGFSIFYPRSLRSPCPRVPHTSLHPCDFPVPRLISDHRSSFVRSVMGVPLLSGREHAHKKTGKKSSPLVSIRSLHLVHSTLPFFDWSKFSDFVPFRCPCNHLCLCASAERAPALFQRSFMPFRSGKLSHD